MKYVTIFIKYFRKFPIFRFKDARLFLIKNGASEDYIRKFMSLMIRSGRIYRITKGSYTLHLDPNIAGFAFRPFYYGLGTALNFYKMTEQQYNPIIITPKNVRSGVRVILGQNTIIRHIKREFFFGYEKVMGDTFYYYVSDVEKTLIDSVYYNHVFEVYVYMNIMKKVSIKKLKNYLKKYNKRVKQKTLLLYNKYKK